MRAEIRKTQDLLNLAIIINTLILDDGRPPLHFSPLNPTTEHAPKDVIIISVQKTPAIDLTTPRLHHTNTSYQTPPPLQTLNSTILK